MKILVINSGSSSIKYQLFNMPQQEVICSGLVERIGLNNAKLHYKSVQNEVNETTDIPNHKIGLQKVVDYLLDKKIGVIQSTNEIEAVGHRVVHGGSTFANTTIITDEVKNKIKSLFSLAPLHNPPNLEGIEVAEHIFPNAKQIAVFDTAFHQTMPKVAYKYAIPNKFLDEHHIRVYGFHGTSHKYVSEKAIEYLDKKQSKIITIHLGNGCSMTAIKNGKSIDHTLGFGPVTGLIMGTRSGDIDHALIYYLVHNLGYDLDYVNTMLQKESGMLGLTGLSDLRDIEAAAEKGNENCQLALDMNAYRIKKYIGAYTAVMNGLDAIVFTAGIGENSSCMRKLICSNMDYLGIDLDEEKNNIRAKNLTLINSENSKVKVLIIPTNEEVEIAKQSFQLL
ncbi:MAG: acetate/propionate family kinase [Lutibacter sp.]